MPCDSIAWLQFKLQGCGCNSLQLIATPPHQVSHLLLSCFNGEIVRYLRWSSSQQQKTQSSRRKPVIGLTGHQGLHTVTHPATITGEARNPLESFSEHFPTLLGAVTKFSEKTFWMSEHG